MSEPLSGPIKAITGNGTLTTQYIVHFSAAFQFCAAVRRGRHVTRSEIAPSCFVITDEAVLSGAIQTAHMTKLAVVHALFVLTAPQWIVGAHFAAAWSQRDTRARRSQVGRTRPQSHAAPVALEPPRGDSTCSRERGKECVRVVHGAKGEMRGTGKSQ